MATSDSCGSSASDSAGVVWFTYKGQIYKTRYSKLDQLEDLTEPIGQSIGLPAYEICLFEPDGKKQFLCRPSAEQLLASSNTHRPFVVSWVHDTASTSLEGGAPAPLKHLLRDGTVIRDYRICGFLAAGGYAQVYWATSLPFSAPRAQGRFIAIKVVR